MASFISLKYSGHTFHLLLHRLGKGDMAGLTSSFHEEQKRRLRRQA